MNSQLFAKKVVIFGCGNTLFGDDGFGPAVIESLNSGYQLPKEAAAIDAGTAVRDFIFDLLLIENKPESIWIIDAVNIAGKSRGEVFEIELDRVPQQKMADFSLHQCPSSNLLHQLKELGVDVRVLGMQTPAIPNEIHPGLSSFAHEAIPIACNWVIQSIKSRKAFK